MRAALFRHRFKKYPFKLLDSILYMNVGNLIEDCSIEYGLKTMSIYQIQEAIISRAIQINESLPLDVGNIYSPRHGLALRMYLKEELGGEICTVYPHGVLLTLKSHRVQAVISDLPLIRIFDDLDLGSRWGRESKLFHVIEETNDAVGIIQKGRDEMLWFHRS